MKIMLFMFSTFFLILGCATKSDVVILKSGLRYSDLKVGNGPETKNGELIEFNFRAWIVSDSSELFSDWSTDSTRKNFLIADSYSMNQTVKFILGSDNFIKGAEEGIVGMKAGGQRVIVVPPNLAYGPEGMGPIPPNSSIKLVVDFISNKEVSQAKMWEIDSSLYKITSSGLNYAIISEGEGPVIEKGKQVVVHYSGFLLDGTKFDSSVERDEPFTLTAGVKQVIPGWDEGLLLLKKKSKARFIIPPALAYGDRELGKIPPNSTLIFDVEILDVK